MISSINSIRNNIKKTVPLIHCITNPISINQSANAILAVGGRPTMVEYIKEVKSVTSTASALLLNLGNMTAAREKSILAATKNAVENDVPAVLDLVGVSCLGRRRNFAKKIIKRGRISLIKGNYSEVLALCNEHYTSSGVDAEIGLKVQTVSDAAIKLSQMYGAVVLASGKRDIITSGDTVIYVDNGCEQMSRITGTGCLLGALCACFSASETGINAAVTACVTLGVCGELAGKEIVGNGSFLVKLIDELSLLTDEKINEYARVEVK